MQRFQTYERLGEGLPENSALEVRTEPTLVVPDGAGDPPQFTAGALAALLGVGQGTLPTCPPEVPPASLAFKLIWYVTPFCMGFVELDSILMVIGDLLSTGLISL